jgi:hypothetical protein
MSHRARLALALVLTAAPASSLAQTAEPAVGVRASAELGFLFVADHFVRFGVDGSRIDYRRDGAQDNLYPFARLSAEIDVRRLHHVTLLYQPLEIVTRETLTRDLRIDGVTFPNGTPVQFRYGFPFFRAGWHYDLLAAPDRELSLGLAVQLRNATIDFESLDGRLFRGRSDVGVVPLLRARGRFPLGSAGAFFAFEVDGFYAPISVLNGSDNEVTGAILDASVRVGWRVRPHVDLFVNLRYIGGGATGQGDPTPTSDGSQSNWLNFVSITGGATIDSRP